VDSTSTLLVTFFLAITVSILWSLPKSRRRWLILTASILFYALWRVEFVLLIVFSAFVDYYFSLKIYAEDDPRWRKLWLLCSLTTNLGLLGYFKYTYFIVDNIRLISGSFGENWTLHPGTIILPLGISFYTFLSISYTLDVYRRLFKPVRNFVLYLSYVMFWPHMIAGPILRAHELIPQLVRYEPFDINRMAVGMRRLLFGLFLKVALADQLAPLVDDAFLADPSSLSGLDVWTMAFGFGLQIYFDFAGYSMIAIGSALLLGIHFPENFNWPYMARSPREFWKRWHITLSSWIRDYLYLPLSGIRYQDRSEGGLEIQFKAGSTARLTFALFATWFLMGAL
jgi:alginate O-acetyltransferase complex protein AlgI